MLEMINLMQDMNLGEDEIIETLAKVKLICMEGKEKAAGNYKRYLAGGNGLCGNG